MVIGSSVNGRGKEPSIGEKPAIGDWLWLLDSLLCDVTIIFANSTINWHSSIVARRSSTSVKLCSDWSENQKGLAKLSSRNRSIVAQKTGT